MSLSPRLAILNDCVIDAADPAPAYAAIASCSQAPHSRLLDAWLVAHHDDVRRAFTSPRVFSSRYGVGHEGIADPPTLLDLDPPQQTRHRRIFAAGFSRAAARDHAPDIRSRAQALLSRYSVGPGRDLQAEVIDRVAVLGLSSLLGLSAGAADTAYELVAGMISAQADDGDAEQELFSLVQREGDSSQPVLAAVFGDGAAPVVMSRLLMLFLGGFEPLSTLCGSTLLRASQFDDHERLTDADWDRLISATARAVSPTQYMFRTLTEPADIAGKTLAAGDRVALLIAAANLSLDRSRSLTDARNGLAAAPAGLAFGAGPHVCLGQWLARVAVREMAHAILERVPKTSLRRAETTWSFSDNVRRLTSVVLA
jgi:cytochrome P450